MKHSRIVASVNNSTKYFDPETLARIRPIGLRARTLVEGLVSGMHRSALRGQSLEFSQHREYVPGDDLRQVDWKVFARSDKHYVRQYEDETNLTAMLLLDHSESMDYGSNPSGLSKLEYAELIACSLGYLITSQQDSVGLATFSDQIHGWLKPSSSPTQLDDIVHLIEKPRAAALKSKIPHILQQCVERLNKPHLVILLSDLLDELPAVLRAFELLQLAGHDLLVLHLVDRWELTFPFDQTAEFTGLEGMAPLVVDPLLVGGAYRRAMQDFCRQLEIGCLQRQADYFRLVSDESLAINLPSLLSRRSLRQR
jgi:uncharacterized protein (DUF58 family)